MKAILVNEDRSLRWDNVPDPILGEDDCLIKIEAAALNRADLMQREGDYPPPPGCPDWMGLEIAGTIVEIADGAKSKSNWKIGDKVCALLGGGGYAEYANVKYDMLMPVPENCTMVEAAAMPEAFATAYLNLFIEGKIKAGNTLLMNAGASGLASVIIPMAKAFGVRVITTVLTEEIANNIKHLNADRVVVTTKENIVDVLKEELENGHGVDVAIDCLGGEIMGKCIHYLTHGARWIMKKVSLLAAVVILLSTVGCGKYESDTSSLIQNTGSGSYAQMTNSSESEPDGSLPAGPYAVTLDGVENVRDIGGMPTENDRSIRKGILYRAGEMDSVSSVKISESGVKTAVEQLKIKTDLDLRKEEQTPKNGTSPLGNNVNYINLSAKEYYEFLAGETNEGDIMRVFADINNYPILFHCVYGADRTGTVAYLLEALAGVSEADRIKDYEMTSFRKSDYFPFRALSAGLQKKMSGSTDSERAFNLFKEKFGMTEMEISNIYNILVTDSAVFASNSLRSAKKVNGGYGFNLIMRNSRLVKSVRYNGTDVDFTPDKNGITVIGAVPVDGAIGKIVFGDDAELNFQLG